MASIYQRGSKLWLRVKATDGTWSSIASGFSVGEERKAEAALRAAEQQLENEARLGIPPGAPLTVRTYSDRWIEQRKRTVRTWKSDESRLRLYVLPVIGDLLLADVRARHLADLFRDLRTRDEDTEVAPKTIHNTYAAVRALFRDAVIDGLVDQSPCVLTEHQLGPKRDADPEWRKGAQFTRAEAEALISDVRIPFDRRVLWALMVGGGLRIGEAAGLRWRNVERDSKPLGRMFICTSYDTGTTKTGESRMAPIHPTVEAILAKWRGHGWADVMGRAAGEDDLVCPLPKTTKRAAGAMRAPNGTLKLFHRDLATLGFPLRRVHDLRRTFISLARSDGAEKHILKRATHAPSRDVMEGYTTFEFEVVCREVGKLSLGPRDESTTYEGDLPAFATVLATVAAP